MKYKNITISLITCMTLLLAGCSGIEKRSDVIPKKDLVAIDNPRVMLRNDWEVKVGSNREYYHVLSLDIKNDILFAAASSSVAAVKQGKAIWTVDIKQNVLSGPTVSDRYVLLGMSDGVIRTVDANNGNLLWQTDLNSEILARPTVYKDAVYIHTLDGGVTALNLKNGRQLWRFNLNIPSLMLRRSSAPFVTEEQVFIGFSNGKLGAINRLDGTIEWIHDVSIPSGRSDISKMIDISADTVVVGDIVFVVSYQGNIAAYDKTSGNMLWSREMSSISGMSVSSGVVYVSAANGEVWALSSTRGENIWVQKDLIGRTLTKPVLYKNYVIVIDDEGLAHFLSRNNGGFAARHNIKSGAVDATPIVKGDKMYVYSKSGSVIALTIKS